MSKTTILIVEDEAIIAADLAGKLGRLGYEVAGTAAQGEAAVALACHLRPHLVLMDIWLKGSRDGIETAEVIRRQYDVPVIYLTAHSDPATLARAKLTGPFGYILKPFEERDLATQIEMALYRHQADRQLRQQREWLRVTLTSIGDAVVATDAQGRVSFVNPVAELLTGWKSEEAVGQPVQCVFRIVNEQTGQPLEEPVARVLREGRAVELANHAAVVTKDGRTVPVEDSAAPILDAAGQVIGAVLVFHDVTEKRRGEEQIRRSRDELETKVRQRTAELAGTVEAMKREVTERRKSEAELARHREHLEVLVKERTARLEVANAQLQAEIVERQQAEEAMAAAKSAAEAANVAKSQFLANMSHELRTPMNAILGMIDLALPKASDPIVQDCLQTAKGSADLLLTLLNDLLDSAKVESGKLELESAPFSLRRMLDQITRVLAVRASEKGLAFYCRVPDETPDVVVGDRTRLQQVLLNLAGNAVKFTEKGEIVVRVEGLGSSLFGLSSAEPSSNQDSSPEIQDPRPGVPGAPKTQDPICHVQFSISDTGIGIPPSGLKHLFQPFAQADATMSRRFGGTGLGLSISKSLVELMGGTISVDSEPGRGSTFSFTVRLPLTKELPADFEAPVAILAAAGAPLRILLVEDNPANQKLATYILQDRGHSVEIAGDGQEALCLAERNRYDVILMDVQMPGMNGLEATAAIRARERAGGEDGGMRVPIIAMTAHAMRGDRERCLAAGMNGYLSKPLHAQEMIGLVESLARGPRPAGQPPAAPSGGAEISSPAAAAVFDPEEALARCFNSADMVREIIHCFFTEVDNLFPQMRAALEKGDLVEVGRLGHRMKGTVVYLAAQPAKEAALRVERFCKSSGGAPAEAEQALNALEHECMALKTALRGHPLAAEPAAKEKAEQRGASGNR